MLKGLRRPAETDSKLSDSLPTPNASRDESMESRPMMIEVPRACLPEVSGAVNPHLGSCEGGVGKRVSLMQSL
jgi:hypothetical protein